MRCLHVDGDSDLLYLLPDEDLVSVLLPGDRLLSLLHVLALDELLLSDLSFGDLDLVLEDLLFLEARLDLETRLVLEPLLDFEALLLLDDLLVLEGDLLCLRAEGVLDLLLLLLRGINRPPALSLPLEGDDELSGVPHDLLSCLLEPVLLLVERGDGDTVWLKLLVVVGNLTLSPCLPEVPAWRNLDAGATPALLCLLVVTIVSRQTLKN